MSVRYQNYIDGQFVPHNGATIDVHNPATHELIAQVPDADAATVDAAIAAARRAQPAWEKRPAIERAGYLRQIAARLRESAETLARTIAREQGKVLPLARTEVTFTADYIDYMAEWARRLEGEVLTSDRPGEHMFLLRKPLGVTAGILPWNFPFFLIARKMAPALITGNTIVVIEHNLDVIKVADWVIDLGPGAGARGGEVVAMGRPATVASVPESATGRYLAEVL